MNKLYFEALKALPDRFVSDHTKILAYNDFICAIHQDFHPIIYRDTERKWVEVKPEALYSSSPQAPVPD